jgi:hypothetical protein
MKLRYFTGAAVACLALSMISAPAFAASRPSWWEDSPPSSLQISDGGSSSKPYGFITHQNTATGGLVDNTFQSDSAERWGQTSSSKTYRINMEGAIPVSPYSQADLRAALVDGVSNWHDTLSPNSAVLDFNDGGQTGRKPSHFNPECDTGNGSQDADGLHDVGFCDLPSGTLASVRNTGIHSAGSSGTITEVDTVFDNGTSWSTTTGTSAARIYNVAMHEAGHWQFLGDMYGQLTNFCANEGSPQPIMCAPTASGQLPLTWGDKDGARFLYPEHHPVSLSITGSVAGSDSAVALIDGNSSPDMMFVWGDFSGGQTTIKAKGVWDISSSTGAGTVGTAVNLVTSISGEVEDIGATLYNIGAGSNRDLIVTWIILEGTTRLTEYRIFYDITRSGSSFSAGSSTAFDVVQGSQNDLGTDVGVFDMNGDGDEDMVVFNSFFDGADMRVYYYYGELPSIGTVDSWSTGTSSGTHKINDESDVGISFPYPSSRIGTLAYKDNSDRMRQHYFHFLTTSKIDEHIKNNFAPRKNIGDVLGLGAGDALNLAEQSYPEQYFSWVDSSETGYYMIEWDSRLNSHV